MAITPLPTAPSRSDPGNFTARADAFMAALPTFANEANALQTDVNEKQVTANAAADTATTQATNASASSAAAAISANNAAASTGAVLWVSGTTYALGFYVRSPANARIYRKLTASSSTTIDPSADVTNYTPVFLDISSGYPTTQPSLNLDFANTKQLDPRITFVRNSTAAYYDGQTSALAEQNLLLQSQTFATTWVTSNTTLGSLITAPDGTTTAYPLTASAINGTLLQTFTDTANAYTFSIYIQRVTGTGNIDITVDGTTYATQTTTGTWTRFNITTTPSAGSKTAGIRLAVSGDVVNIWCAQLEQRSSVTAYTPTTTSAITNYIPVLMTAPAGVARFDCDPITGKSLGLLIEESRTNLFTYSSDFSNAAWTKGATVLYYNQLIAPDGTLTATLIGTASSVLPYYYGINWVSGISYTYSIFVKPVTGTTISFRMNNLDSVGDQKWTFNSTTGVITKNSGIATATSTVTNIGNSWYRLSFTSTANQSATGYVSFESGTGFAVWGAQLEAGAFPTSYIPTVASTVTRATDQASMTGTNFSSWYNQSKGSFYVEADSSVNGSSAIFTVRQGVTTNYIINLFKSDQAPRVLVNGVTVINLNPGTQTINVFGKLALSRNETVFTSCLNALTPVTATATLLVPTLDTLFIGSFSTTLNFLNGHIKKLSYYPVALSSSNLVALTS